MSLGTNISRLRQKKGMSQEALAQTLEVSRQSVSKWETDVSVPELEKLLRLAELFDVSLDELIRDIRPRENPPEPAAPEVRTVYVEREPAPARRTVGIVLLTAAALAVLIIGLYIGLPMGLMAAAPFVICGMICLFCRRRPGLWCAWAAFGVVSLFVTVTNGTRWDTALFTLRYRAYSAGNTMADVVSLAELLAVLGLILWTALSFRDVAVPRGKKTWLILGAGWLIRLAGLPALGTAINNAVLSVAEGGALPPRLLTIRSVAVTVLAYAGLALTTVLVVYTAAAVRGRRKKEDEIM